MKKTYPMTEKEFRQNYLHPYFLRKPILLSDDLTVVIRAHLLVETLIELFLINKLSKSSILENDDFTFAMKIDLADALGLIPNKLLPAIKQLNKIRNKFAHNITTSLKDVSINDITGDGFVEPLERLKYKNNPKALFGEGIGYLLGYLAALVFKSSV